VRKNGSGARARLEGAIRLIDPKFQLDAHDCQILEGDVTASGCGLGRRDVAALKGGIDEIWHSAASVNFSYQDAEGTRRANVGGTENVLGLASDLGLPPFHHVSTAYVAGFSGGRFLETDHLQDRLFKNTYEKTKLEAEHLVHRYGGKHAIYRPSVIVGDSERGTTLTFTGYYRVLQVFNLLRLQVMRRLRKHPEEFRASGIYLTGEERLHLPLIVPCSAAATLNLVPVDWVADTMIQLAWKGVPWGMTFHVTHPEPPSFRHIIEVPCRMMGIEGLRFEESHVMHVLRNAPELVLDGETIQAVQKNLLEWLNVYWPYFSREPVFDDTNVRQVLNSSYQPPRPVTDPFLRILTGYALGNRFKQRGAN